MMLTENSRCIQAICRPGFEMYMSDCELDGYVSGVKEKF